MLGQWYPDVKEKIITSH